MSRPEFRAAAVVLAAGAGTRFSDVPGAKLAAELHGKPVLWHVLTALREVALARVVVVLGHGSAALQGTIDWAGEQRVVNRDPDRGLASSIRIGFEALGSHASDLEGAFIVLGDQPTLRPDVLRALMAAAAREAHAGPRALAFAPRYRDDDPDVMNPVLLVRSAWALVDALEGDRGLAGTLARMGERFVRVDVAGSQVDVDTAGDLAALSDVAAQDRDAHPPRA